MSAHIEATEKAIRKILKWDTSFVKRRLRSETRVTVFAIALWIEVHRIKPRQRLVKWLCDRIPTMAVKPVR